MRAARLLRQSVAAVMTDGSASLKEAIAEAKSVMRNRTSPLGKRPSESLRAKTE